jgi:CheY-like chemotaxis protein
VREIYRSSKYLLHLTEDVLELSKSEAGQLKAYRESTDLHDIVNDALDMIRPLVHEEDVALRAELPVKLPEVVVDRERVQQVLLNLLNNARRFTDRGSITVRVSEEGDYVRVTVADTGSGIPVNEHENVFKEFHQLDGPPARRQSGSGLGLAISKRFVEMHGGRIWLESEGLPGRGSCFHFTLPFAGTDTDVPISHLQGGAMQLRVPTGRGRAVVFLGGDANLTDLLERKMPQYRVVPTDDIEAVPRIVDEVQARAILVNGAVGRSAWQYVRKLRRKLGHSSLPIILCPFVSYRELGEAMGVVDYLVKPFKRDMIVELCSRLDTPIRRVLVVDDDPQMIHVFTRMLESVEPPMEVLRAHDGAQGLEVARQRSPDLILLDLKMPKMDGYSMLAQLQKDSELCTIPVAVVTAQTYTLDDERRLGGPMMFVYCGAGFTNEEAAAYLCSTLEIVGSPLSLRSVDTGV